jgi:hypothetical protein
MYAEPVKCPIGMNPKYYIYINNISNILKDMSIFFYGTNKQNKPGISSILIYPPPKKPPEDHFLYDISQCSMRENLQCYKPIWVLEILLGG